ncbi:hypothetical protein CBR_g3356 [Chara braunii]|uniref:Reverse transcriptase domain-containing protein n=1 Tax=Chara braunii TaxID=69332 RepID=A0A388JQX9_CHABU|nr:hypothetical protein CBR_g3356 [Chara braunii]|eukprot:GBG60112.1 hypothetical protein CBR_g3356 [Chara braunii]
MTERELWARWKEHVGCTIQGRGKRSRNLYNWLGKLGVHKYVAIPVFCSNVKDELEAVERTLIREWAPSLNSEVKKRSTKKRCRAGKKERAKKWKREHDVEEYVEPNVERVATKVSSWKRGKEGEASVRLCDMLRSLIEPSHGKEVKVYGNGGGVWSDKWRVVLRLFGESRVKVGGRTRPLRKCKKLLESGGEIVLRDAVEASPRSLKLKKEIVRMFKNRKRAAKLAQRPMKMLVHFYSAAKLFSQKKSRSRTRKMISDAIKKGHNVNIRRTVVVKVRFDERVKRAKVVRLVRRIEALHERLEVEISQGLSNLDWLGDGMVIERPLPEELMKCVDELKVDQVTDVEEVLALKRELRNLVLALLDRNPGDTLVMCPSVYFRAMRETFIENDGYVVSMTEEAVILSEMEEFRGKKYGGMGKWKAEAELGSAYVLPKHKDTTKFRPICPTYCEPGVMVCKTATKCLNAMLFGLPESGHFNLKSVSGMGGKLERMNRKLGRTCSDVRVMAVSYDIKDMFSKLLHSTIMKSVEWCIWWYKEKGFEGVVVKRRGRETKLCREDEPEGYRRVESRILLDFITSDLRNCYTKAGGYILLQKIGIPMGKSSSPPSACLMCAKAE